MTKLKSKYPNYSLTVKNLRAEYASTPGNSKYPKSTV